MKIVKGRIERYIDETDSNNYVFEYPDDLPIF